MTDGGPLADQRAPREVLRRAAQYQGNKWSLVVDDVLLDGGVHVRRDVVVHPGAVGVVALDEQDRVVLIRQYRHPVEWELWELPAGLLDEPGESPLAAAKRELFEEAHLRAGEWDTLLDMYSSPGMTSELVRVYLARQLSEVPDNERHVQTEEERDMPTRRLDLTQACQAVMEGRIHNAMAVAGVLATDQARRTEWSGLRPADEPWLTARKPPLV
ncbi:MAG TPA: NUDIX hydrolase [Actinomycetes bacterium]|nr:NUDIX hydrolase [Actinomycetes bacterium]